MDQRDLDAAAEEVVEHFTALFAAAAYASVARDEPAARDERPARPGPEG